MTAVEETIKALKADPALKAYTICAVTPKERPERMILVQRAGGETSMFVDRAGLVIDVYAPTQLEADRTGEGPLRDALFRLPDQPNIGRTSVESMFEHAVDPKHPQYEINVRVVSLLS